MSTTTACRTCEYVSSDRSHCTSPRAMKAKTFRAFQGQWQQGHGDAWPACSLINQGACEYHEENTSGHSNATYPIIGDGVLCPECHEHIGGKRFEGAIVAFCPRCDLHWPLDRGIAHGLLTQTPCHLGRRATAGHWPCYTTEQVLERTRQRQVALANTETK